MDTVRHQKNERGIKFWVETGLRYTTMNVSLGWNRERKFVFQTKIQLAPVPTKLKGPSFYYIKTGVRCIDPCCHSR